MPQRLYGRRLKSSNEQLLQKYGNLAKHAVGKYARAFRLTRDQAEDLLHSLLVELFRAPRSYRNRRGISILIGSRIKDFTYGFKGSLHRKRNRTVRLDDAFTEGDEPGILPDERKIHNSILAPAVLTQLEQLSSPERAVLGLSFGIEGHREMSDAMIAIRLGKPKEWVEMKRKQGIFKIQRLMGIERTAEGL